MAMTDNLISYWKMDEASGTRVDVHGSNDLTDNNTVTQAAGILSNAAVFASANDESLSHVDNADLSIGASQNFSYQFWLYPTTMAVNKYFLGKTNGFNNATEVSANIHSTGGNVNFRVGNNSTSTLSTLTSACTLNAWNHIVLVWDGSNQIIYANDDGSPNTTANTDGSFDGSEPLHIGSRRAADLEFDGRIDEVGFWKRALTSGDVTTLYNSGAGLAYPFTTGVAPTSHILGPLYGPLGGPI